MTEFCGIIKCCAMLKKFKFINEERNLNLKIEKKFKFKKDIVKNLKN